MLKTLEAAEQALLKFVPPADSQKAKYTLDRVQAFMEFLGSPQQKINVIHVAGTSGKTSTSYFLAELLKQAGLKVGLTISPHIDKITERIQINGVPIADEKFAASLQEFIELIKGSALKLTYFEVLMAFAYSTFANEKVDVAVVETGLGGLLDASNVVKSKDKTCVITDIGLDHTAVLGNRLEAIATQKAGIILPGNQVFMLRQAAGIEQVMYEKCQEVSATLNVLSEQGSASTLPLFQRRNFSLALQVAEFWLNKNGLPRLGNEQVAAAAKVAVPARMEVLNNRGKTIVLDGAHNIQKMQAFVASFKEKFSGQKAAVLLAVKSGKDHEGLLEELLPITDKLIITGFEASQDMPISSVIPSELARDCESLGFRNYEVAEDTSRALQKLQATANKLVVVTGSLYLAALVRHHLRN
jgi:dihydrofolate synthase/folylpolyglutamate synthase